MLDDREFLTQFENLTLPPAVFNHVGHLRLARLNLQRFVLEEAVARTATGIGVYAASLGAADKFHRTLTEAIVRIMYRRHAASAEHDFIAWLAVNTDLVEDCRGVLASYYSDERLYSEAARATWVPPDLRPISATRGRMTDVYHRKAG